MSNPMNMAVRAWVGLGVLGTVVIASAQSSGGSHVLVASGATPAEVIGARQQGFKKIGAAFKSLHRELSGPSPDAAKIAAAAADIKTGTDAIAGWFPPGSGPEAGVKTQAKAEIWSDAKGFAATRAAFVRQVEKSTRQLSDPGERAAWKDSSAALGQACKDCHDSYRVKG
jgi:cytochrome c556